MHTLAFSLGFQPATTPLNPSSDISGFTSLEIPMGAVIRTANYDASLFFARGPSTPQLKLVL